MSLPFFVRACCAVSDEGIVTFECFLWDDWVMKTLTEVEIDQILEESQVIVGGELQQVRYNEKVLQLNFYKNSINYWLTFSMKPGNPYFFLTSQRVHLVKSLKKPLNLFFKTHFNNVTLKRIERIQNLGRVIRLDFANDRSITLNLIPGRVNIEVQSESKTVFANKPKDILEKSKSSQEVILEREVRDHQFFEDFWKKFNSQTTYQKADGGLNKELKKKKNGLNKMLEKLERMKKDDWAQAGEWLKTQADLSSIPDEWISFIDTDQSISWNIENCFKEQKKSQLKLEGTELRVEELKKEIALLESGEARSVSKAKKQSLLSDAKLKGKTIEFAVGRLFIGKSGSDNLKLLRKAKPWYLWLHIKDYPGAYGILEKPKKQDSVDEKTMVEAAQGVIRQSLPAGTTGRFELIYAECRYVRPIKGAKSGQVTYSHEKVMSVKV